jgi:hypothetical protein
MTNSRSASSLFLAISLLAAFGAAPSSAVAREHDAWRVNHSTSHAQCPWRLEGPAARVFTSPQHWQEMMTQPEDKAADAPVDWRYDNVIVFATETQRTLGLKVKVDPPVIQLSGREARLQVRVSRPKPGQMQAAAISRPCVVAVVPRRAWRVLEVRSEQGQVLWRGKAQSKH